MTGRADGKVAIITGAARGMGAVFARCLVEQGAKVMLTDILEKEGQETASALGSNARFLRHDVTKEADWKSIVKKTEADFGPVSVLINNAGIGDQNPIETMEEIDFRRVVDINQVSVFLGMKSVLPSMKRAGDGSIINVSSVAGLVGFGNALGYTATKFAVRGMTKTAAIEFAQYKIRVNSIHPGFIRTPMTVATPGSEEILAMLAARAPAVRPGEPEEVANVILMLASDESRFCTGAEFVVDGGFSCL